MRTTKGIIFLHIIFFLFCASSLGFSQTSYITISGKIIDKETSIPIPFANIGILGKSIGTISNTDGAFIFKFPAIYQKDSIKVSFTGYQSYIRPVSGIGSEPLTIHLQPAIMPLQEVQVKAKGKSALDIIKEAIAAIPANYDTSATQMMAFYQEETKMGEEEIVFVESILEVNRPAYGNEDANDQIKTVKERRKKIDHSKDFQFYVSLLLNGGAKYALRNSDMVKAYQEKQEITIHYSGKPKEPNRAISMDGGFFGTKIRKEITGSRWFARGQVPVCGGLTKIIYLMNPTVYGFW